jgi:two-component system chemotaxis response regulator CheY
MKVLVVDDSKSIRSIEKKILQGFGFEVFEASQGEEALQQLNDTADIGLVLVDRNMPVMDGLEFVKSVRANPDRQSLCLVMVTSETDMGMISEVLAAGADEYVMKPFNATILQEKLALLGVLS